MKSVWRREIEIGKNLVSGLHWTRERLRSPAVGSSLATLDHLPRSDRDLGSRREPAKVKALRGFSLFWVSE
jgi:hypothetical protein